MCQLLLLSLHKKKKIPKRGGDWQWHSWAIRMLSIFLKNRLLSWKWTNYKKSSIWGRTVHSGHKIGQLLSKLTCFWFSFRNSIYSSVGRTTLANMDEYFLKSSVCVRVIQNEWLLHEWTTLWKWSCFSKAILEHDQKIVWIAPPHSYYFLCKLNSKSCLLR